MSKKNPRYFLRQIAVERDTITFARRKLTHQLFQNARKEIPMRLKQQRSRAPPLTFKQVLPSAMN